MGVVQCCHEGCAHRICFEEGVYQRLRDTGEWWFCPAGHRQHFTDTKESRQRQRIEQLERLVRSHEDWLEGAWDRYREERAAHTETRRRARTCPLCGTVFRTPRRIPDHLVEAHGAEACVFEPEPTAAVPS